MYFPIWKSIYSNLHFNNNKAKLFRSIDEYYRRALKLCTFIANQKASICWRQSIGNKSRSWISRTQAGIYIVCYTAVFSVVTQRSSPLTAAENRTTFLSRD